MVYLVVGLLSLLAGVCYRIGGLSKSKAHERFEWLPQWLVTGATRDIGVSLLVTLCIGLLQPDIAFKWHILHFLLLFVALHQYWSRICKPNDNVNWLEWCVTGFCYGLSALGYVFGGLSIKSFVIRLICVIVVFTVARVISSSADTEEIASGIIVSLSTLIYTV